MQHFNQFQFLKKKLTRAPTALTTFLYPIKGQGAVVDPGFPVGGTKPLGAPTSDVGAFW